MAEFMQKFDKNNDGKIELSEVRNCIVVEKKKPESAVSALDEVRLQMALKIADI